VSDTAALAPDSLPAASLALTVKLYVLPIVSPVTCACVPVEALTTVPSRKTEYPVTPTASVEAAHDRSATVGIAADAVRAVGLVGAVVSVGGVTGDR
jgi:hypothetical protein